MVVAIWCGTFSKPKDLNGYLREFVTELNDLLEHGIYVNEHYIKVVVRCFICDTPARAFIRGLQACYSKHFIYILRIFCLTPY